MRHADLVFEGGRVFSGDAAARPGSRSVAVREGVIVAVGSPEDVQPLVGPRTERVDTTGRLLIPGFQDAHAHPVQAGVELTQCDLSGTRDADECLRRIADYAAANPSEAWIVGAGWSMEFFPGGTPTRESIDRIVPDRPVALINRDHHGMWVNSRALELAGITVGTADPSDGRIERDSSGAPSGTLHEGAVALIAAVRPQISPELAYRGLLRGQQELLSLGITSWQDALIGDGLGLPDTFDIYRRAAAEGALIARVTGALWWERERGLDQVPELIERRDRVAATADPSRLAMDTVKIMVDGVAENFTAAISHEYLDATGSPSGNRGLSFIDPGALSRYVTELDAAGFAVHFHSLGDRAVTEALDALASARRTNGPSASRHQLAHLQLVATADVPRFAALDAIANIQPLWACHEPQLDELTLPFLDPELAARHYPFGDLLRAGVRLAAGSDWPVSSANPLAGIRVAATRVEAGSDAPPLGPEQRLPLAPAFAAYTSGAADALGRGTSTGRITPGYRADLVVLDSDPFDAPPEGLDDTHVLGTWIDGRSVYTRM